MKVVGVREARRDFVQYIQRAQDEAVLVTRHGKPALLMCGVEGEELEDLLTAGDPAFWKMIAERRARPESELLSLEEVSRRLGLSQLPRPRQPRRAKGKKAPARRRAARPA